MNQGIRVSFVRIVLATLCALNIYVASAAPSRPDNVTLTIEASYSRQAFSPERGESVAIRYNVSRPAKIKMTIIGPDGREWYNDTQTATRSGYGEFKWAGVNDKKIPVPAEAYRYRLTAETAGETAKTGMNSLSGGVKVDASQVSLNVTDQTISYLLRQPARVRIMARLAQGFVPLGTLADWEARPAGLQTETVSLDKYRDLFGEQEIVPVIQAWALPPDSIIVLPKSGMPHREQFFASKNKPAGDTRAWFSNLYDTSLQQHATHEYDRCYDPAVSITSPGALPNKDGKWLINQVTTFSLNAATDQGVGRVKPIPRLSLFVFVDDVMVTRLMPAYLPYQWKLDPANYLAGDHVVTLMLSWRDDHIGVAHQKINIAPDVAKPQKD